MEVEAKAAFANLQKRYQKRRITLRRPEKLEQGSKEMEKPINGFKDMSFFSRLMISRVNEYQKQIIVSLTYRLIPFKNVPMILRMIR